MKRSDAVRQVPNTYLRQFFRFLGGRESLLVGTAQTAETLARLDGSNSFRDYCQFFRNARDQLEWPDVGLALGRVNQLANMHGPVSSAVFQSVDIEDCLRLLYRFTPLRLTVIRLTLLEDSHYVGLQIDFKENAGDIHVPVAETLMLSLTGVISAVSQGNVRPSRIELDYPRPTYASKYPDAFRVNSFRFDCAQLRLLVSRADAHYPTGTDSDPNLRAATTRRCEELLRGVVGSRSTAGRITQVFTDNPGHLWTLGEIATHLNSSPRTLQRRLFAENTSYQQLYNDWLKREARSLLGERSLSVESISQLLGYSDVSNFRQACRRWFGKSPDACRGSRKS